MYQWQPKNQNYEAIQDELATITFPYDLYSHMFNAEFAKVILYWEDFFEVVTANLQNLSPSTL